MSARRISVRVPATSANLGPGFDCLGLALDLWGQLTFSVSSQAAASPENGVSRLASEAFRRLFLNLRQEPPVGLVVDYDGAVPVARGLGASAVVRAAGLLAANAFLGEPLDREQLLVLGAELEGHADNVAPALFGGLQVVAYDGDSVHHVAVPVPDKLGLVLFIPDFPMSTQRSRRLLPQKLSRGDAVYNIGRAALLVGSLAAGRLDPDLVGAAIQDRLHQPARSRLFPAMYALFTAAREAGALGAYLSGSGSTICALTVSNQEAIAEAMEKTALKRGVKGRIIITSPTARGAELVES